MLEDFHECLRKTMSQQQQQRRRTFLAVTTTPSRKVIALGAITLLSVVLLNVQNYSSLLRGIDGTTLSTRFVATSSLLKRPPNKSLFVRHMEMAMAHDYSFDGTREGFLESGGAVVSTGDHHRVRGGDDSSSSSPPPRFVLGIFSMDSESAAARRRLIRDTYLTRNRADGLRDPRVCSLTDRLEGRDRDADDDDRCVVFYAFVVAAHDLDRADPAHRDTDHFRSDRDLVVPRDRLPDTMSPTLREEEDDVIFLNVRENMNEGKSPTWFKWASTALSASPSDGGVDADYVAKVDDDTLVYFPAFFRHVVYQVPPPPHNVRVYGGKKSDWFQCGRMEHCESVVPHGYMAGPLYFLSVDLARDFSSDENAREYDVENVNHKHFEDMDVGRWVFADVRRTWRPVTMVTPGINVNYWLHPIKSADEWIALWNGYEHDSVPLICAEGYGDPKNPC